MKKRFSDFLILIHNLQSLNLHHIQVSWHDKIQRFWRCADDTYYFSDSSDFILILCILVLYILHPHYRLRPSTHSSINIDKQSGKKILKLSLNFISKISLNMHEYICLQKLTRWRFERLNQYLNLEKIQINHQSKFSEKH